MAIRDGLGFEEVNQASSTALISGTNVYAKTAVHADTIRGDTTVSGTTTAFGNAVVTGSVVANSKVLSSIGTGSPTTWGMLVQGGSAATGTGSNAWVAFGTAFSSTPTSVVATQAETKEDILVTAGSINAGSFYVETTSASQTFTWLALGA